LIIVRITLTEPKTALAGVMLEISFARFKVSMAALSEETTFSRRFCRRAFGIHWFEKVDEAGEKAVQLGLRGRL
jgi:hypothetical protein